MSKTEWDEFDEVAKNEKVWSHFPEIEPSSDDWVLSTDDGETGFDFFDTEAEAKAAREEYEGYPTYEHAKVFHWRNCMDFTTDRNACALVLDEIAKKKLWQTFSMNMQEHLGIPDNGPDIWVAIWCANRANPDTICYCAIKAVE